MTKQTLLLFVLTFFFNNNVFGNEPIIIGLDADVSAVAKSGGLAIQRGAEIAINEINAQGGVIGRKLQLKVADHRGNPARGKFNIKQFSKLPNLAAIIGGVHTPVVLQELEIIHQIKVPFLIPWAAGTPIIENKYSPNFVFRVSVKDDEAAKVLVAGAKKAGHQKIGLLLEQTGWGRSNEKSMLKAIIDNDLTNTHIAWFNWRQRSMLKELQALRDSGATAILLVANAPEGATIIRELAEDPLFQPLDVYSHWGLAGGSFVKLAGKTALSKVKLSVLQTYSFLKPHNQQKNNSVLNAYQKLFDKNANEGNIESAVGVAHAYDLVHILAKAIEQANSTNPIIIREQLENIEYYQGLVKNFKPPFEAHRHDSLFASDYFLANYDENGYLVPMDHAKK
jgi:branched-chain amino acid transport system substrate-binding protein